MNIIFTIGHSTHTLEHFGQLLREHEITAVADVRSAPSSRFTPQFNREALSRSLKGMGVAYVFLGHELGARSPDPADYIDGVVQYDRLARHASFRAGIDRLESGSSTERIAIMCAEQEPLDCHRTVLVAQHLASRGASVQHIHGNGSIESHSDALHRLMASFGLDQPDLLHTENELAAEALARQEKRIAYVQPQKASGA